MGLHRDSTLLRFSYAFGSCGCITGLCRQAANDEDGATYNLSSRRVRDFGGEPFEGVHALGSRSIALPSGRNWPNQEIEISRELVVTTSATKHTVPSLGFVVWDRRQKLKPELAHLSGNEIRDLKLSGAEVTNEIRLPLVAYTGDTSPAGLDNCPDMYRAETLITEMTFLAPNHRREKIHKHGHMHLDDIVARRKEFQNKNIICGHFSVRYSEAQIHRWVAKAIPDMFDGRLKLWV